MTDRALLLDQLADAVDALTRDRRTVEHVQGWTASRHRKTFQHAVVHAPLLTTLLEAAVPAQGDDEGGRSVPGPRPPVDLNAVDALHQIQREAWAWRQTLELDVVGLTPTIQGLGEVAPRIDAETLVQLVGDARRWVLWAEIGSHERPPLFRPDAPCPVCDRRHGLRVLAAEQRAWCVHCQEWWDEGSIGVLGAHVARWTNERIGESA
ncbi:MAG TPA: hypothetical protein VGO89_02785 [Streptomyces sp.]|nr:hypothetical protein [Streptomyces sp.]